jgi:RHS repeat-associated protein
VTRISQTDGLGRLTSLCEVAPGSSLPGQNGTPAACGQDIAGTGFLTTYQYDALNNLLQVNQGTMAPRTFAYDSLARLTSASNPESGAISYTYDANDNLLTKTSPAPNQTGSATVTTSYQYDALNRITSKSYSDGTTPPASFFYDKDPNDGAAGFPNLIGRLFESTVAVPSSVGGCVLTLSGYDPMGRIISQVQYTPAVTNCGSNYAFHYSYDLLGNMLSSNTPYEETYSYTYNTAGRLITMTDTGNPTSVIPATLLSGVHYNGAGQITSETLGTGDVQTYGYSKRNQLQSKSAVLGSTNIYSFNLTLAPNGDVTAANDSANGNWNYSYDQFNRLVCSNLATNGTCASPTSGTPTYSYVYDRFGNRWQQNGPLSMQLTFTGNNPASPANNNRIDGYAYDAAGNLLSDKVHTYTYDAENRLVAVDGGKTATYFYDADGRRVHRTGSGTGILDYIYDLNDNWVSENNSTGANLNLEIYAGPRHLASLYDGSTSFDHTDWLGTSRLRLSYPATNLSHACMSLPFGDGKTCVGGPASSPLVFTGKEHDYESGLDNFGARYMGSSLGRFMTPDPDNAGAFLGAPQSWNAYSYVANNPLNATDPNGLDCLYAGNASDNPDPGGLGTVTVVRGDCINANGKNDSGVFVDNAENHPVQSSDVTLSDDRSVGIVSYTRTDGFTTGYACFGNCPSDSAQVSADTPTMGPDTSPLTPFQRSQLPPPQKPLTILQLRQIQGCMAFMDPELAGPILPAPTDFSHANEAIRYNTKATQVKDSKPKRPGPAPQDNRKGEKAGEAVKAGAGGVAVLGDVGSCIQNAVQQ